MSSLQKNDPELFSLIGQEEKRQQEKLRMIASENYVTKAVREATGSVLTNKYSEGYSGKRYYEGQQIIDRVEDLAIARAKALFGAEHVNVQPYSGSPANLAVYLAFIKPGDTILGMNLAHGGHLTHGSKASISGKYFNAVSYSLSEKTERLDYDEIRKLAREHKPKIIVAGHSAYPRIPDFAKFREIADEVGALLLVDMAHFAGLVAGGAHPSPVPFADVVSTTTHKTLRGPRGGMLLCKEVHAAAIDKAVFPGCQGGPHNNTTAAMAVAFREAAAPEFKTYARRVVENAAALAGELLKRGYRLVTGGTDNHLILMDLASRNISGKTAAQSLDRAGIVCNYNKVPGDTRPASDPGGIRMGAAALTTRGFGPDEMKRTAALIDRVISSPDAATEEAVRNEVAEMVKLCPLPEEFC